MSSERRKRVALLFRYGVRDHAELHSPIPEILRQLGQACDVLYAGPNADRIPESYRFPGVRYLAVPFRVNRARSADKALKTLLWYLWLPWLGLYLRWWRADLIWVDESIPLVGGLAQLFSSRPLAQTVVDFFVDVYAERWPWARPLGRAVLALERRAWRRARGLITRSESMRQQLIAQGVDANKVVRIRDAFDLETFRPARAPALREKLGFGPEDVVLVHHGVLHPNKGLGRVLEWMIPLLRADARLKFLVVGNGPELPALRRRVERENLAPQVRFTGWLPSSHEVSQHLNASDIGLAMRVGLPSDHFHVTGALVHCLLCGLPVLAARLRGMAEIVTDGVEGFLFDPASPGEFRAGLEKLRRDPGLRARMGAAGREKAIREFDPRRVVRETVRTVGTWAGVPMDGLLAGGNGAGMGADVPARRAGG